MPRDQVRFCCSFSKTQPKGRPLSILLRLGLFDQIYPLHNFYFKVHLLDGVDDESLVEQLKSFNDKQGEKVFHSVFDGDETFLVQSAFVLENPPALFSVENLREWVDDQGIASREAQWYKSPLGASCLVCHAIVPPP